MKGVLLVNLGSPDSPEPKDVKPYLEEFLMDERVIDVPKWLRTFLVKGIILNTRPRRSAKAYKKIWWDEGSPSLYSPSVYKPKSNKIPRASLLWPCDTETQHRLQVWPASQPRVDEVLSCRFIPNMPWQQRKPSLFWRSKFVPKITLIWCLHISRFLQAPRLYSGCPVDTGIFTRQKLGAPLIFLSRNS